MASGTKNSAYAPSCCLLKQKYAKSLKAQELSHQNPASCCTVEPLLPRGSGDGRADSRDRQVVVSVGQPGGATQKKEAKHLKHAQAEKRTYPWPIGILGLLLVAIACGLVGAFDTPALAACMRCPMGSRFF